MRDYARWFIIFVGVFGAIWFTQPAYGGIPDTLTPAVAVSATATPYPPALNDALLSTMVKNAPTNRLVYVDQAQQMMFLYEDGQEVRRIPVSTGMPTSRTMTRSWQGKVGDHLGGGPVQGGYKVSERWFLFQDLFGSILIHTVPYKEDDDGHKRYDQFSALGNYPASHGCIRISHTDAHWLEQWNPTGAKMIITRWPGTIKQVSAEEVEQMDQMDAQQANRYVNSQ